MMLDDIPLFSMLKDRLGYLNQRQQMIAQNVANSDTPGYMPHDLKPFTVADGGAGSGASLALAPTQASAGYLSGTAPSIAIPGANSTTSSNAAGAWQPQTAPDERLAWTATRSCSRKR